MNSWAPSDNTTSDEELPADALLRADDDEFLTPRGNINGSSDEEGLPNDLASFGEDIFFPPPPPAPHDTFVSPTLLNSDYSDDSDTDDHPPYEDIIDTVINGLNLTEKCTKSTVKVTECNVCFEEKSCRVCHKCGKAYCHSCLMENHNYNHLNGKRVCCGDCKEPIELSLLQQLSEETAVMEHLASVYMEKLNAPVFTAFTEVIKELHRCGFVDRVTKHNRTIIQFLFQLIKIIKGKVPSTRLCPTKTKHAIIDSYYFLDELIRKNPIIFVDQEELALQICDLAYSIDEIASTRTKVISTKTKTLKSEAAMYYKHGRHPTFIFGYSLETDTYNLLVREVYVATIPIDEANRLHIPKGDNMLCNVEIPELGIIDIRPAKTLTLSAHSADPTNACVYRIECVYTMKQIAHIPDIVSERELCHSTLENITDYAKYLLKAMKMIASLKDKLSDHDAEKLLDRIAQLESEIKTLDNIMHAYTAYSPSSIINSIIECITKMHYIPKAVSDTMNITRSVFARHKVPLTALLDAVLNVLFPNASACTKSLIVKTIMHNKGHPITACPRKYLKSLMTDADNTCDCGGPIVDGKCILCASMYCDHCHEKKGDHHVCFQEKLDTIRILKETTVKCPHCHTRIQKSEGCNHMFCTHCHCNFDWVSGKEIRESDQTNDMFMDHLSDAEQEYHYYLKRLMNVYADTTRSNNRIKDKLYFSLIFNSTIRMTNTTNTLPIMRLITNKETYLALRSHTATAIMNALNDYGEYITDIDADLLCDSIVEKAITVYHHARL